MDPTKSSYCRQAAARCRKTASLSATAKSWIVMAKQWEFLADIESEATVIDCRTEWPPPAPYRDAALSLAGYPEKLKKPSRHSNVEFRAYVNMRWTPSVGPGAGEIKV
jgi:hypothetical protein